MEDCKINYDFTVRNASGSIIQFLYGEDGMDAAKIESQPLIYIEKDFDKLKEEYLLTKHDKLDYFMNPAAIKEFNKIKDWEAQFKTHFDTIMSDREYIITKIFDNKKETSFLYPISLMRLINNSKAIFKDKGLSDLNPMDILNTINSLSDDLYISKNNPGNMILKMLLRCYLSPKKIIFDYKFSKSTFDYIIQQVKMKFYDAIAHPSEMVGVIAAQSIGEPATQLTLNSVEWHTPMLFNINNKLEKLSIGKFIDDYIDKVEDLEYHPHDTTYAAIKNMDIKVLSSNTKGQITWEKVEAVTKHPPINKDGTNTLLKVITRSGREVIATKAKSFLKRVNNEIVQVNGDEIKIGDHLPISKVLPIDDNMILNTYDNRVLDNEFGYHIGLQCKSNNIELPSWVYQANIEFIKGVLESVKDEQLMIRAATAGTELKDHIIPNIITKEFGEISVHRDKIPDYITKSQYSEDKTIFENILREEIMYDEVIDIQEYNSEYPYVYDLTVANTRNFNIFNGLCMADTFHLSGVSSASKAVRGVPRIKELLSVTRNIKTPALTIYLKDPYNKDKMKAKEVLNTIQTTYFADIVKSTKIYYDPDDFNTTIEDDKEFLETYQEFINQEMIEVNNLSPWLLRLEFNKDKMLEYDINMMEVYNAIQDFYEDNVSVMFSDDNANKLVFRIKIHETEDKHDDIITDLKALEKNILENLIVKGIKNMSRVVMNKNEFFEYNQDTLTFEKTGEWVLETRGTNLIDILAHPNVDASKTISNDINEIYETLGIEAARQALFNELADVIKFADLYVNYRHLSLLADTMTNKGYMLSIDRHGINRVDIGPLAKSSFEETNDMIIKAGIFSELDKINGVSANIILGQVPPCGTGDTDILIDEEKLMAIFMAASQQATSSSADADNLSDEVCQNIAVEYSIPSTSKTRKTKQKQSLKIV